MRVAMTVRQRHDKGNRERHSPPAPGVQHTPESPPSENTTAAPGGDPARGSQSYPRPTTAARQTPPRAARREARRAADSEAGSPAPAFRRQWRGSSTTRRWPCRRAAPGARGTRGAAARGRGGCCPLRRARARCAARAPGGEARRVARGLPRSGGGPCTAGIASARGTRGAGR